MRLYLAFVFCFGPFFGHGEETLRALFACDTISDIRTSTKHDVSNLKRALHTIAKQTNLSLKIDTLDGDDLTINHLHATIKSYTNKKTEVILFYYSGHGYRTDDMKGLWPRMFFPAKKETILTEEIISRLQSLGARLIIILLDCCNNPAVFKSGTEPLHQKMAEPIKNLPGLKTLFLTIGFTPEVITFKEK
jgi:hypothetical protein